MKRLKQHISNLLDDDKYGWLEDVLIALFAVGTLFFFIYCVLKSGGVI